MLKKARQGKHGGHPTILSRWYASEEYRKSLNDIGWREHHIVLYDRIALEKHHVEPRVKLYMPKEESIPISMKYIDVTRTTRTSLEVLLEKQIDDYWNVDGERELSDVWTGLTRFISLTERPPDGYTWSGRRLTRKQTTSRPDNVWPDVWKQMSDAAKSKAKQKWAIKRPKLENARHIRGIFFMEPEDE